MRLYTFTLYRECTCSNFYATIQKQVLYETTKTQNSFSLAQTNRLIALASMPPEWLKNEGKNLILQLSITPIFIPYSKEKTRHHNTIPSMKRKLPPRMDNSWNSECEVSNRKTLKISATGIGIWRHHPVAELGWIVSLHVGMQSNVQRDRHAIDL